METAVADIVDNSIAASADHIDITWDWNAGQPIATILDDGQGMSEERLVAAMRFGGAGPRTNRSETDLGRFGLGLKTASLSQCRMLSVISRTSSGETAFTWDIDYIAEHGSDWHLIEGGWAPEQARDALTNRRSGTLVVWSNIDFGREHDRPDHSAFLRDLDRLSAHLGMVFHRFIDGDARRITITLNGNAIPAWDPFLESHAATIRNPEAPIRAPGGIVRIRGFVLPHRDRFPTEEAYDRAAGPKGCTAHQGFYVYRQKRMLSSGGWLGLGGSRAWTQDEASRLARIRIDIPNSADHEWCIDIRKAIARPPEAVRKPLQKIAEDIRRKAREVFVHRGNYGPRQRADDVSRIWQVKTGEGARRYRIDREHQLVALVRDVLPNSARDAVDTLLDHIERTVPIERVWLDVTEAGVPPELAETGSGVDAAASIVRLLEKNGTPFAEAVAKVASMDPFDRIGDLEKRIRSKIGKKGA